MFGFQFLFKTITELSQSGGHSLHKVVARMSDNFEVEKLNIV